MFQTLDRHGRIRLGLDGFNLSILCVNVGSSANQLLIAFPSSAESLFYYLMGGSRHRQTNNPKGGVL